MREDKEDSLTYFLKPKLEDICTKPQDWIAHMVKEQYEMANAGYTMEEETFLTYIISSLPQEEYQFDNFIEETETLLDDMYESMREMVGWTEDGDELALHVRKPHFKKTSMANVGIVASMDTRHLIVMKEKSTKKTRKMTSNSTWTGEGENKPNQQRKPFWKQVERGKVNIFKGEML